MPPNVSKLILTRPWVEIKTVLFAFPKNILMAVLYLRLLLIQREWNSDKDKLSEATEILVP